jgi:hypothetical protein
MAMESVPYETRLRESFDFALRESSAFYDSGGALRLTLNRLAEHLDALGIPYALIGALALAAHGYVRMTADVDIVMTSEGLARFREAMVGRGYRPAFEGARRAFRDVETQVRIEVVESGAFPGDGRPKPVAFPNPEDAERFGMVRVVGLATLVELKLTSGLSAPHRLRDLADVQELIRQSSLPLALKDQLDPSVREEYERLWRSVHDSPDPFDESPATDRPTE